MARKIRLPDEDIEPVWDKMSKKDRAWYEEFKKATEYYNWESLAYLCEIAPSDQYDRLFEELNYESHRVERERYTLPKQRFPKYSEADYGWAAPKKISIRNQIQYDYFGQDNSQLSDSRPSRRRRK